MLVVEPILTSLTRWLYKRREQVHLRGVAQTTVSGTFGQTEPPRLIVSYSPEPRLNRYMIRRGGERDEGLQKRCGIDGKVSTRKSSPQGRDECFVFLISRRR